ncbi:uncharacterized protein CANTADRAFT_5725 [Suhomyces tanzawaensis NRRL Y-17324]|uniref:holo-[acyl-carrier-protein] synthase n=1 Tax=Suhomyces tanzawaensis NRRL Y-17324 TaxID=984487 RepID=A0A1E4SKL8_9ASCO|nr:uncharacterized protein CANTADRAFT_5725 [Suhomyces tanzawaensis NRRL Y-17324]ODV80051.1 hypothetical protein CANTADRAFT_5725 [Suhomyces tanzawaensis NRRL Y-17324]
MVLFSSRNGTIWVFTSDISSLLVLLQDDFNFETVLRLLDNPREQQKVLGIKDIPHRIKTMVNILFTRVVLNAIIEGNIDDPWKTIQFSHNKYGKPLLEANGQKIQFNSSTSDKILSIAIEFSSINSPIGIDLSHSRQTSISDTEFMEQFLPMFHPREHRKLIECSPETRYFMFNHLWTLKEALTKLLGCGLNIDLSDVCFDVEGSMSPDKYNSKQEQSIEEFSVVERNWFRNVEVDIEGLVRQDNEFVSALNKIEFHTYSTVVRQANFDELPVILSLVSQNSDSTVSSIDVNMEKLLNL